MTKTGYLLLKLGKAKLELQGLAKEDVMILWEFLMKVKNPTDKLQELINRRNDND